VDRATDQPVTLDMAKARLRHAAADIGVRPWIRRHPLQTLVIAATTGFVVARAPDLRSTAAVSLIRGLIRTLV
jgi:hypothetical protein